MWWWISIRCRRFVIDSAYREFLKYCNIICLCLHRFNQLRWFLKKNVFICSTAYTTLYGPLLRQYALSGCGCIQRKRKAMDYFGAYVYITDSDTKIVYFENLFRRQFKSMIFPFILNTRYFTLFSRTLKLSISSALNKND